MAFNYYKFGLASAMAHRAAARHHPDPDWLQHQIAPEEVTLP